MLRFFIPISLLIILAAAILLQYTYRKSTVETVQNMGETTNIALAKTALFSIRPQLDPFLARMVNATPEDAVKQGLPADLGRAIHRLISESTIARIKICNPRGVVLYSTLAEEVGQIQLQDDSVQGAINGKIMSEFQYNDRFNADNIDPEESNLIQTYLPALNESLGTVLGVVEIAYDVNSMVKQTEQSQVVTLATLGGTLLLMLGLLIATSWRAEAIMIRQYNVIHERIQPLESLTSQMFSDQEIEKKNIANGLHESVAQTLFAIKMKLEAVTREVGQDSPLAGSITDLGDYLQQAIRETSDIASNLRPSTLDELGLSKTLDWFFKSLESRYPRLTIERDITGKEENISQSLKVIIFRIVQDTLNNLATQTEADHVKLALSCSRGQVQLDIEENSYPYASQSESSGAQPFRAILPMKERTLLSGGHFSSHRNRLSFIHRAQWET